MQAVDASTKRINRLSVRPLETSRGETGAPNTNTRSILFVTFCLLDTSAAPNAQIFFVKVLRPHARRMLSAINIRRRI